MRNCIDGMANVQIEQLKMLMDELYSEHPKPVFDYACILLNHLITDVDNLTRLMDSVKMMSDSKSDAVKKYSEVGEDSE